MPLAGHDLTDFIRIVIAVKCNQMLPCHEVADGHALVNQTGSRIRIIGCGYHGAAPVLGNLLDGHGHPCPFAHNDAGSPHLDGAQL